MPDLKQWDLWWATVAYQWNEGEKERPVIVIDAIQPLVLALPVTSHEARNQWGEYEIVKWQTAGLDVPSIARIARICEVPRSCFRKRIGRLDDLDIQRLQALLTDYVSTDLRGT